MMRSPNSRRPGLSLTEVLVALFVMALGIISLMTLFPLGAVQMGQALRDDRSGQTASQADGITRIWWQTRVVEGREPRPGILSTYTSPTMATLTLNTSYGVFAGQTVDVSWSGGARGGVAVTAVAGNFVAISGGAGTNLPPVTTPVTVIPREDDFFDTMDNPNYPGAATLLQPQRSSLDPAASYPVFVDPLGWYSRPVTQREWISTSAEVRIPRRSVNLVTNLTPQAIRACSMMDDITFNQLGAPDTASGSTANIVVREGAFNWCAVIQRPNNTNRYVADFKVLVFHTKGLYGGHVPGTNPAGAETILSIANGQLISANAGGTQVSLNVPIANLPLRSGSWIMDGSNSTVANFYRIQSITELTATSTILELDAPLKSNVTQLYIIRGLADVFDRPQLTNSGYQRQAP